MNEVLVTICIKGFSSVPIVYKLVYSLSRRFSVANRNAQPNLLVLILTLFVQQPEESFLQNAFYWASNSINRPLIDWFYWYRGP